jgi:hypothetical protein
MPAFVDPDPQASCLLACLAAPDLRIARRWVDEAGADAGFSVIGLYEPAMATQGMRWRFGEFVVLVETAARGTAPSGVGAAWPTWLRSMPGTSLWLRQRQSVASKGMPGLTPYCYVLGCSFVASDRQFMEHWYSREHLPGLAQVPGTARARRFETVGAPSRSYAFYDIDDPQTLRHPQWLANRTAGSSPLAIPLMQDIERTMLRRIGP